jgi:hypothetical protein
MPDTVAFRLAAIILLIIAGSGSGGCLRSDATRCGDITCPIGRACAAGRCVDSSIMTACARHRDGETCALAAIGSGSCQTGMCIVGACGDGVINAIDACDGKELGGKTCLDFGSMYPEGLKCAADCSYDTSGCKGYCGDGLRQSNEQCDSKAFGGKTCITEGFYTGNLVCTSSCTINTGGCNGKCGDGIRNSFTEQCDGKDFGGSTCEARGFHGTVQELTCSAECSLDPVSCTCGDVMCKRDTQKCVMTDGIATCEAYP